MDKRIENEYGSLEFPFIQQRKVLLIWYPTNELFIALRNNEMLHQQSGTKGGSLYGIITGIGRMYNMGNWWLYL